MDFDNLDCKTRLKQICRVCMLEHIDLYEIFECNKPTEDDTKAVPLVQIFNACTQYKVELNDNLPQHVCGTCRDAAQVAYRFKCQTEEAYRVLKGISGQSNMLKHVDGATQTDDPPMYGCEWCAAKFIDGYALREHRRKQHGNDTKCCKVCNTEFGTLRQLQAHLLRKHPNYIQKRSSPQCYLCHKHFSRKDHLNRHMRNVHKQEPSSEVMEPLVKIEEEPNGDSEDVELEQDPEFKKRTFYTDDEGETSCDDLLGESKNVKEPEPEFDPIFVEVNANDKDVAEDILESWETEQIIKEEFDPENLLVDSKSPPTKRGRPSKMEVKKEIPLVDNSCPQCKRTFSRRCHLRRHMLTHLSEKPFPCMLCDKRFTRSDHLKTHVNNVHGSKEFRCDQCKSAFVNNDLLARHMETRHGEVPNAHKIHACDMCEKKFSSKKYLVKHRLLHTHSIFACKHCDETYTDRKTFREHERTHSTDRNFLCSVCGESFVRVDYLRIHMRRHTGEKPYKCQFCGKGFPRATDVKMHERYHTGTKPSVCNLCGKAFHRAYNLTIHMRTHTGERPYKCDQCSKSFAQSNDLKAHIRRHTGERFKCQLCDAAFLQMYVLRQHMSNMHGIQMESNTGRLQKFFNVNTTTATTNDSTVASLATTVQPTLTTPSDIPQTTLVSQPQEMQQRTINDFFTMNQQS